MSFLPMTIGDVHETLIDCLMIEGEFTEDFGPWKKGYKTIITWNFEKGVAEEFNDAGELINSVNLILGNS